MKLALIAILALAPSVSYAEEPQQLTVNQCLEVLAGLNALNYVGQQLADQQHQQAPPSNAPQYHLGAARMTLSLDLAALRPVQEAAQKAQQDIFNEISGGKQINPGTSEMTAYTDRIKKEVLDKPCPVSLGRLNIADLKIGDGPDQNPIPIAVLSVLVPIVNQ